MTDATARRERIAALATDMIARGATPNIAHAAALAKVVECSVRTAQRHLSRAAGGEATPAWGGKRTSKK